MTPDFQVTSARQLLHRPAKFHHLWDSSNEPGLLPAHWERDSNNEGLKTVVRPKLPRTHVKPEINLLLEPPPPLLVIQQTRDQDDVGDGERALQPGFRQFLQGVQCCGRWWRPEVDPRPMSGGEPSLGCQGLGHCPRPSRSSAIAVGCHRPRRTHSCPAGRNFRMSRPIITPDSKSPRDRPSNPIAIIRLPETWNTCRKTECFRARSSGQPRSRRAV